MSLQITIDALTPYTLAKFWAEVLPTYEIRPYDDREIARLASIGLRPETDTSVPIDGDGPTIWFQKSGETTKSRNRIHFDLAFADKHAEADRLLGLGAKVRDEREDHVVLLDPEGNQFCLFDP